MHDGIILGAHFGAFQGLTTIDLHENALGAEGCQAVCAGMPEGVTVLDLSGNSVGGDRILMILETVSARCPSLTRLNISSNAIGSSNETCKALVGLIEKAATLQMLEMRSNDFDDTVGKVLSASIRKSKTLDAIDLRGNTFGKPTCEAMFEAICTNSTLATLNEINLAMLLPNTKRKIVDKSASIKHLSLVRHITCPLPRARHPCHASLRGAAGVEGAQRV